MVELLIGILLLLLALLMRHYRRLYEFNNQRDFMQHLFDNRVEGLPIFYIERDDSDPDVVGNWIAYEAISDKFVAQNHCADALREHLLSLFPGETVMLHDGENFVELG